jgi:membrane protein DedA with SNARE-associated domain
MGDLLAGLASWVTNIIQTGGYPGIALLTLIENLFPPIPSELILPVAGFLTRQGQFAFVPVVVAATIGSLIGALVLYGLGAWLGQARLEVFVRQHGRWLALEPADVERAEDWFRRHGGLAVLLGRLLPSLRSLISIPAGVARMPLLPFVAYTLVGSTLWNTALVAGGWFVGDRWDLVQPYLDLLGWAAILTLAAGLGWFVWRRKVRRESAGERRRGGAAPA